MNTLQRIQNLTKFIRSTTFLPCFQQIRHQKEETGSPPRTRHLICFKDWTSDMVMEIINSALTLKVMCPDTHGVQMDTLCGSKIMILQEVNQPILNMAISKASTMLGASYVNITDNVVWEQDYMGRIFSQMSDAIFVSTTTHMCVRRFSETSLVPVMCVHSRTHASIQALATVMTITECLGKMDCVSIGYVGPPHPVLNSLLLLCPMLGADIRFKCCCDKTPVTPLLFKASEEMAREARTVMKACNDKDEVISKSLVIIAGPTPKNKEKIKIFSINVADITKGKKRPWFFMHTLPRGEEVNDDLFYHENSLTYQMFNNMVYIVAALMANAIKETHFL